MRNITLSMLFIITSIINGISQDTFSIVAMDPITGEVGSAGASCVDLDANNLPTDDFLGELFPGLGAINSQARRQADVYSDRNRFFNRPDYSSIPRYIEGIDRNVHNPSGTVFKKHGRDALTRSIMEGKTGPGSIRYSGRQNMLQLKKDVMRYPSVLDDILGAFRINAREKGYSDKAINDMVRKFIDHLYLD